MLRSPLQMNIMKILLCNYIHVHTINFKKFRFVQCVPSIFGSQYSIWTNFFWTIFCLNRTAGLADGQVVRKSAHWCYFDTSRKFSIIRSFNWCNLRWFWMLFLLFLSKCYSVCSQTHTDKVRSNQNNSFFYWIYVLYLVTFGLLIYQLRKVKISELFFFWIP